MVPQLASLLNEDAADLDLQQFRTLWHSAAERADALGRHLLLVVDGLDEDLRPAETSVAAQLPARAGGRAHVLVSSRTHPKLPPDIPAGHPLLHTLPVLIQPFSGGQELEVLARQEIDHLLDGDDDGLATDVLGLLAAAAGPLAVRDLVALTVVAEQPGALARRIRELVTKSAARSLQHSGLSRDERYQFAHESLLAHAQRHEALDDPDYHHRIHLWAEGWRAADWPTPASGRDGTPRYLLDAYPSVLADDPQRLVQLAGDIGWVEAAIASAGVDLVVADLRRAAAADPDNIVVSAVLAAVVGQAYNLRPPLAVDEPGYILRQLWMQAAELAKDDLAEAIRIRLKSQVGPRLIPIWTTRRASYALSADLGRHDRPVAAVVVLADGRVVTGGADGQILAWDPAHPGATPAEVGRHRGAVYAMAVLADGRVVTGGADGQILAWDPAHPGATPAEVGRHPEAVYAMAVLADGRLIAGGYDGRMLVWNLASPQIGPAELGRHHGTVRAVAVLPDERVITAGGYDGQVLIWDPIRPDTVPAGLGHHDGTVHAMAVLADGRVVTVGGYDGQMLVHNRADPADSFELGRHYGSVQALAVLADGRVVTGGADGRVLVWDPAGFGVDSVQLGGHYGPVAALAVLADGRVVTGGTDGRVLVWDPAGSGVDLMWLGDQYGTVTALAVLADGRVVTGGTDGRVLVWNPTGPDVAPVQLGGHYGAVRAVAVLADGRVITGGDDRRLLVWDPARPETGPVGLGRDDVSIYIGPVYAAAVLADERVVTGGYGGPLVIRGNDGPVITSRDDGQVLMWDPAHPGTGPTELGRDDGPVQAVAVLADGRVVSGSDDLRVRDPGHPEVGPTELGRDDGPVQAVAVLADGRIITGGYDGRVLVWNPTRPGTGATELGHHDGSVLAMTVLADGWVITGGDDGRVLVWNPAAASTHFVQVRCSVTALAMQSAESAGSNLIITHQGGGFSLWLFADDPDEMDPSRNVQPPVYRRHKFGWRRRNRQQP